MSLHGSGRITYRYKIVEEMKQNEMSVEKINITKNWRDFDNKQTALDKYIRTKANPDGFIDYQVMNPEIGTVLFDTMQINDIVPKLYTYEELIGMTRKEIEDISNAYGVSPTNKRSEFLCKIIIKKQNEISAKTPTNN